VKDVLVEILKNCVVESLFDGDIIVKQLSESQATVVMEYGSNKGSIEIK
jgi:hypothetical protein